jgi:hypothetical protein
LKSVKAAPLNNRASTFSHLIPNTSYIHQNMPTTQQIVHGISTTPILLNIGELLTTFNMELILSKKPL